MNIHLKYLLLIRTFAIGGQLFALFLMQRFFSITLPLLPVLLVISALAGFTLVSWYLLKTRQALSEPLFFLQLLADVVALSILIYYTGGSVNPFISLFMLPIIFAAASMGMAYSLLITLIAVACYTLLMFFHVPVVQAHSHQSGVQLHIWGMWYGFILSAGLVAYFVSRIAVVLRQRDRALAAAREEALRNERILALGTLAAGTAHELGTPLSTVAVLCAEMLHENSGQPSLAADLRLIREQIDHCKAILARMASDAGQLQAGAGHAMHLNDYLQEITDDWRRLRPEIRIHVNLEGDSPAPLIVADRTLTHAIINIFNNAADASSTEVGIEGRWHDENLTICVSDNGRGLPPEAEKLLGRSIYSGKPPEQGMGIGLFLAQSTLNRLGGHLEITRHSGGGTRARIEIPLQALLAGRG